MATGKPYQPSLLRRVQQVTHGLTLDLYRRTGDFWEQVHAVRRLLRTDEVPRQVPPPLPQPTSPAAGQFHHPPETRHKESGAADSLERWNAFFGFCGEWCDAFGAMDSIFPLVFLSGCVCYDPPHDDLLGFANHADNLLGRWYPPSQDADPPLPGLPIVWVPDLEALARVSAEEADDSNEAFVRELKFKLITRLDALGLDGHGLWAEAEAQTLRGMSFLRLGQELPTESAIATWSSPDTVWAESTPLIAVEPETTEADVRLAFQWIKQRLPAAAVPTKSPRDPLLAVQCAVWRDRFDWSEHRIGARMGWAIQESPIAKPRCETARQHIAEGRLLLGERADAA